MKKIFAFILASIMVLSLVPASAFAAFNMCPDTHTKANCDYVFVTSFPASCSTYGYSVYACKTCGAEFLDDFSNELNHPWISTADSKHVNKAATCTVDGYEWVKCSICTNYLEDTVACGGACGDANCMLYKRVIKAKHSPVATGNGVGCETEYKCTVCGTILYYDAEEEEYVLTLTHDWNYKEAEIIVEPTWVDGVFTKGSAHVVCSVEGCPGEKDVEILDMACKHYVYELVKAFVKATCTADGTYGVYACRDCDKYVVDTNGDGTIDGDLKNDKGKATKDLSFAVVKALGHKVPTDLLGNKVYLATANCIGTYECVNCKAILTETAHADLKDIKAGIDVAPTCTNPGYDYQYCYACFTSVPVIKEATGHNPKTITIAKTCVNQGAKYTYCANANCTLIPTPIRDAKGTEATKAELLANGIAAEYIVKDALYAGYTYNLRLTKSPESVAAISSSEHTLQYFVINSSNPNQALDKKPSADCSGFKIVQTKCAYGCAASTTELITQGSHDEYVSKKYANCNETTDDELIILTAEKKNYPLAPFFERVIYTCKTCGLITRYVDTPVQFTMQYAKEDDINYYHGDIQYVAKNPAEKDYTLVAQVRNVADRATTQNAVILQPTCLATGLEIWGCKCCNVGFYKILDKIPHTQAQFTDPIYQGGQAATCDKAGVWASLTCTFCKNTVIYNNYTKEQQIVTSLVIAPHGSTLTKQNPASNATVCKGVPYYECTCGKTFTSWDAKTAYNKNADHHDWVVLQAGVPATCNTNGVYEIKYCKSKDCRRVEVNALVVKEGEIEKISMKINQDGVRKYENKAYKDTEFTVTNMNRKSDGSFENKKIKITAAGTLTGSYTTAVPMLNHKLPYTSTDALNRVTRTYGENHSTPSYVAEQCTYCDFEYFTDYAAASGAHKNKNGEILTTDCDNTYIADRICIYCPTGDANGDQVADNVIEPKHNYGKEITVAPTCVLGGYTYQMCKDCEYRDVISVTAKTNNYHNTDAFKKSANYVEVGSLSNYATAGSKYSAYCKLCNKSVLKVSDPEKIKEAGLEIFASTDADLYIPGSTVYVTITLDSLKGVDVWAVNFPVLYNAEVFEYVGCSFNTAESAFQTFAATDIKTYANVVEDYDGSLIILDTVNTKSIGVLNVVANADENVTVKGAQVLAVLEFKVVATEATSEPITVAKTHTAEYLYGYEIIKYSATYSETIPKEHKLLIEATAIDADKNTVPCMKRDNKVNVEIANFLDLDGKNGITMLDAYELYSLIFNNEYDVIADADCDGRVTGLDLAVLYSILTGAETVDSYINPGAYADITPIQPKNN